MHYNRNKSARNLRDVEWDESSVHFCLSFSVCGNFIKHYRTGVWNDLKL